MRNVEPAVRRETRFIAIWVAVLSVVMEAVFLIAQHWDITVLLGNLLGACGAVLNFFLMGLTVQGALEKTPEDAPKAMRASLGLRTLMLGVICVLGAVLDWFNLYAVLIPLFFPRIAIFIRGLKKSEDGKEDEAHE